jgi:alpha-mannosidase
VDRQLIGFGMRRSSDYLDTGRAELCLNVLQITDEVPHGMSSWQLQEVHTEQSLIRGATTTVLETGPVRCMLEVKHTIRSSTITQHICFYRDLPRIDFETHVDWHEIGNATAGVPGLKASFTAHLEECHAWYETPFAAVQRPADGLEVPALRWADVGGPAYGIALLNDSKYGHDALGCRLRLTLLRSGYDPDPNSDEGEHHIRYSLLPHPGDWREAGVVQAGMSFNQPLLVRQVVAKKPGPNKPWHNRPWQVGIATNGGVQLASVKMAEDGRGRVLRLYESSGRSALAKIIGLDTAGAVYETNIVEDRLRPLTRNADGIELSFSPWQVRTVYVES